MALRILYRLWNKNRSNRERARELAQKRLLDEQLEDAKEHKKDQSDREDTAIAVLLSDELQRFEQELQSDLADAITAARIAYAEAEAEELEALKALDLVQAGAVLLSDRRRAYLSSTGDLIGEDHQEIADPDLLGEAQDWAEKNPEASTYESYRRASEQVDRIRAEKATLGQILDRLDDLETKIDGDGLDSKALIEAREELDEILAAMPASARDVYHDLRAARTQHTTPDADPGNALDTTLQSDFERASTNMSQALQRESGLPEPDQNRQPVYKPVPPFE